MSGKIVDLTGQRFGRLVALERLSFRRPSGHTYSKYRCICDCGNEVTSTHGHLKEGTTNSCGCLRSEQKSLRLKTHGATNTTEYKVWLGMRERCLNPKSPSYKYYGAEGVTICDRWLDSFENFYEDMGERPEGTSLNRTHGAKVYSKDNCEWATLSMQAFDQRLQKNNNTGKTGVRWKIRHDGVGCWQAYITHERKYHHLYCGESYDDAVTARCNAELKYFGFIKP